MSMLEKVKKPAAAVLSGGVVLNVTIVWIMIDRTVDPVKAKNVEQDARMTKIEQTQEDRRKEFKEDLREVLKDLKMELRNRPRRNETERR